METIEFRIGVVMQRLPLNNRWQPFQWRPMEIVDGNLLPAEQPRCLRDDPEDTRWLFGGFEIRFFRDEAEGYFLNADSPVPCWFVMWRIEEIDGAEVGVPKTVTLSYNEAARLMDGGETVDNMPLSPEVLQALSAYVAEHYRPEVKKKRRKPSFEGGAEVDQMARDEGKSHGS